MRLKGKVALITGGGQGIGKAIAIALAEEGAHVIISYRNHKENALTTCKEIQQKAGQADILYADFTNRQSIKEFSSRLKKVSHGIDILVNNAGIIDRSALFDTDESRFEELYHVNVTVPLMLIQEIATQMKSSNIKGSIINISSIRAEHIVKYRLGYCCSKAALNMLTKCAAYELAEFGIRVNAIAPGLTETGMNLKSIENDSLEWQKKISTIPLKRAGKLQDYAGISVFLASDESDWFTGNIISIDGGHSLVHG